MQMVGDGNAGADCYREALNLIRQAYTREAEAIRSASVLAESREAAAQIDALAKTFVETGEKADTTRLNEYATLIRHAAPATYTMTPADKEAAGLVPVRKEPAPQGFGGGGGGAGGQGGSGQGGSVQGNQAPLSGFNAMETRSFAEQQAIDSRHPRCRERRIRSAGRCEVHRVLPRTRKDRRISTGAEVVTE
jgi:hypothetical protein